MGFVADTAPSRGERSVDVLFLNVQNVTMHAQRFHGHDELIAPSFVTALAHPCGIGAVVFEFGLDRNRLRRLSFGAGSV